MWPGEPRQGLPGRLFLDVPTLHDLQRLDAHTISNCRRLRYDLVPAIDPITFYEAASIVSSIVSRHQLVLHGNSYLSRQWSFSALF
jgi:hypothetical protein